MAVRPYLWAAVLWAAFTMLLAYLASFSPKTLLVGSNLSAPVGHTRTQAGWSPASTLSTHSLHFCIFSSES